MLFPNLFYKKGYDIGLGRALVLRSSALDLWNVTHILENLWIRNHAYLDDESHVHVLAIYTYDQQLDH